MTSDAVGAVPARGSLPEPRWVVANGAKTRYFELGRGEPLVLVHGGGPGASAWTWREVLEPLSRSHRAIALDMLGFGETEKAGVRSEMDLAWHLRSFLDALALPRVTLIGNSKGAYWATRMMIDDPERVERCVIVGSNTVAQAMGLPRIETAGTRALDRYDGSREAISAFLSAILETPASEADIDERVRLVNLPGAREAYAALGAFGRRRREPHLWQAYALEGRLPIVVRAVPTLLLWGRKDRFAPVEQAYALKGLLPEAGLEILEASGHQAQNDEPDRFVEIVREFLADQRGA